MSTSINIVTQEEVVVTFDITAVIGNSPKVKEAHQVLVLTVDISKDFDWCVNTKHHRLILENAYGLICKGDDVLSAERKIAITIVLG